MLVLSRPQLEVILAELWGSITSIRPLTSASSSGPVAWPGALPAMIRRAPRDRLSGVLPGAEDARAFRSRVRLSAVKEFPS